MVINILEQMKEINMVHIFRSLPFIADARISRMASFSKTQDKMIYTWEKTTTKSKINADYNFTFYPYKKDLKSKYLKIVAFSFYLVWVPFKILTNVKNNDICVFMDFETIVFGYFAAKIKRAKIVFDIVDPFSQTKVSNKYIGLIIDKIEVLLANWSDLIIVPHQCRVDYYDDRVEKKLDTSKLLIIENVPNFEPQTLKSLDLDTSNYKLVIGYFGTLDQSSRGLEWLVDFSQMYKNDIFLLIAGQGGSEDYFRNIQFKNILFIGSFTQETLPLLYDSIDFTWAYYSPKIELHKYAAPNKFYEHLFFGKPILTSEIIPQAKFIQEHRTGILVNCESIEKGYESFYNELITYNKQEKIDIKQYWEATYLNYYEQAQKYFTKLEK